MGEREREKKSERVNNFGLAKQKYIILYKRNPDFGVDIEKAGKRGKEFLMWHEPSSLILFYNIWYLWLSFSFSLSLSVSVCMGRENFYAGILNGI